MDNSETQQTNSEYEGGGSLLTDGLGENAAVAGDISPNGEGAIPDAGQPGEVPGEAPPTYDSSDWRSTLSDEMRGSASIQKFETVEGLAKSYTNLEQRLGDHLPAPKTDEDRAEIYAALGRPDDATGYEFNPVEMSEGMQYDEQGEQYFRQVVHGAGLSQDQASRLHNDYYQLMVQRHQEWQQAQVTAREEADRALRREQGQAYEGFIGNAKGVLRNYATPEFLRRLDESGMGNDPDMIRVFGRIGRDMGGETSLVGQAAQSSTPADARQAADDYRAEHSDALLDKDHPEHQRRVRELWSLTQAAFN
jgi:hypothetical protein